MMRTLFNALAAFSLMGVLFTVSACEQVVTTSGGVTAAGGSSFNSGSQTTLSQDSCGSVGLQALVGSSLSSIDLTSLGNSYRVVGNGRPMTRDINLSRLTITVGENDVVTDVSCG